jgi:L-asparaginase
MEGEFDPRVAVLRLVPGQSPDLLLRIGESGPRAILLVAFGSGNIPSGTDGVANAIQELTQKGILVAIGSQSPNGRVDLNCYVGGRKAKDAGAIGIGDMTLEAATVKLMYLFGTIDSPDEVRKAMAESIAGELSPPHERSSPFRA